MASRSCSVFSPLLTLTRMSLALVQRIPIISTPVVSGLTFLFIFDSTSAKVTPSFAFTLIASVRGCLNLILFFLFLHLCFSILAFFNHLPFLLVFIRLVFRFIQLSWTFASFFFSPFSLLSAALFFFSLSTASIGEFETPRFFVTGVLTLSRAGPGVISTLGWVS